ncbi:MAG: NHL repeat-containing protein [Acidobacteriota bacterium]|nr:NHL repeat-containing protein [Acidobacteriota bacterium]
MLSVSRLSFGPAAVSILIASLLTLVLSGCGTLITPLNVSQGGVYAGPGFSGRAMAGKLPLIGASVQFYAAGTSGNGSSGTALRTSALTTDSNGGFTVPTGYLCPMASSQIYVVARGGQAGASAASANNSIVLMTALGACNQISAFVVVNEVTTVADAYALSPLLAAGGNLGASASNGTGLQNAVATALALADITAGSSPGPTFAANGSSPAPRIDSIANMLNACAVSSNGSGCSKLFGATTVGGSVPANTLDAALNLVHNPAANVASLYALLSGSNAFVPVLASAPADWTLFVNYTGGGMNSPSGLGVDSGGNIWVANYFNVASRFSPLGKPLFPQGITGFGLSASYGLAVDANDNAWIPNEPNAGIRGNSVTVLSPAGQSLSGSGGFTAGGLDYPTAVVIDTDTTAWVVDYGNSHITHLSSSGQALSGPAGYTTPLFAFPVSAAVDGNHNLWVVNQSGTTVTRVSPDGSQFMNFVCCGGPSAAAFDKFGNAWIANYYGDSISEISSSGVVVANGTYAGGGINHPQGVAIDGSGDVWIANFRSASISKLAGATAPVPGATLSPASGLGADAKLLEAYAIAVDASGNLWISNFGSNVLTEFIGIASPVRTPLIGLPAAP